MFGFAATDQDEVVGFVYFVGFGFAIEMFMRTCEEGFDRINIRWWRFCSNEDFAWIGSDLWGRLCI